MLIYEYPSGLVDKGRVEAPLGRLDKDRIILNPDNLFPGHKLRCLSPSVFNIYPDHMPVGLHRMKDQIREFPYPVLDLSTADRSLQQLGKMEDPEGIS